MNIQNIGSTNLAVTPVVNTAQVVVGGPAPSPATSVQQVRAAVDTLNRAMQDTNQNLEFSVDNTTHQTVVKVMDMQTGDLITQFPSKAALAIAHSIDQYQRGLLLSQKI